MTVLLSILCWIGKAIMWFVGFEVFLMLVFCIYCILLLGFDALRKKIERYRWENAE